MWLLCDKGGRKIEKLEVTISSVNAMGKEDHHTDHCENLINATRMILTFKPKRGYKVYSYHIEEIEMLV